VATTPTAPASAPPAEAGRFSWRQRLALRLVSWAGYLAVRLIGPTLRWQVAVEPGGPPHGWVQPAVYVFWHQCVFSSTWWFRHRQVAVMTSSSFDGEYIARIIERFGYEAVRGSSTRGGVRALLGMHTVVEQGRAVAFTIDGPRGPRHVAKAGPVLLARNTGVPIIAFHVGLERAWVLNSWDAFRIPKPFSRALLCLSQLMPVAPHSSAAELERHHAEMQAALERVRDLAEQHRWR